MMREATREAAGPARASVGWPVKPVMPPDGSRTSADQTITKTGDDKFYWESGNRTLDGDPQPAIGRIEISRVKGE